MAKGDWEHKEAVWITEQNQNTRAWKNPISGEFCSWLDRHCRDGWEVLKISRDFQARDANTWVVFRRRIT